MSESAAISAAGTAAMRNSRRRAKKHSAVEDVERQPEQDVGSRMRPEGDVDAGQQQAEQRAVAQQAEVDRPAEVRAS